MTSRFDDPSVIVSNSNEIQIAAIQRRSGLGREDQFVCDRSLAFHCVGVKKEVGKVKVIE